MHFEQVELFVLQVEHIDRSGSRRVSRACPPPPLEIEKQKKRSSEQILSYFNYILLFFLVGNIILSGIFWAAPPLEILKSKEKKIIRANFKLFHLYLATFLVGNIILSAIFWAGPSLEKLKSKKKKSFQIFAHLPPYEFLDTPLVIELFQQRWSTLSRCRAHYRYSSYRAHYIRYCAIYTLICFFKSSKFPNTSPTLRLSAILISCEWNINFESHKICISRSNKLTILVTGRRSNKIRILFDRRPVK